MSRLELYRTLYEHEKDCDAKMLAMLDSVPEAGRGDARFQQAITIVGHLAACRENWLTLMAGTGPSQAVSWDDRCDLAALPRRFAALEGDWTDYLARLDENQLAQNFEFTESNGERFEVPIEAQTVQLIGHAFYHRGQIALLVDQLGGEIMDTDYVDWWWSNLTMNQ